MTAETTVLVLGYGKAPGCGDCPPPVATTPAKKVVEVKSDHKKLQQKHVQPKQSKMGTWVNDPNLS